MKQETVIELSKRIEQGDKAKTFLASTEWNEFVKPILDSMVKGLIDARDIDVSSDKKAAIEIKSRTLAADYIEKIATLLEAYVIDGEIAHKMMSPRQERDPLIRRQDQEL
jgi:hypothetical protein